MYYTSRRPCYIAENCPDFSNTKYGGHDVYVYVWLDETGKPFYVGSGRGNRASSTSNRNEAFKAKLNKGCSVLFLAEGLHRLGGNSFEYHLVQRLRDMGFNLVNVGYNRDRKYSSWIRDDVIAPYCDEMMATILSF